jgi:hypothetical protein
VHAFSRPSGAERRTARVALRTRSPRTGRRDVPVCGPPLRGRGRGAVRSRARSRTPRWSPSRESTAAEQFVHCVRRSGTPKPRRSSPGPSWSSDAWCATPPDVPDRALFARSDWAGAANMAVVEHLLHAGLEVAGVTDKRESTLERLLVLGMRDARVERWLSATITAIAQKRCQLGMPANQSIGQANIATGSLGSHTEDAPCSFMSSRATSVLRFLLFERGLHIRQPVLERVSVRDHACKRASETSSHILADDRVVRPICRFEELEVDHVRDEAIVLVCDRIDQREPSKGVGSKLLVLFAVRCACCHHRIPVGD